jgi:arsenite methyltransferase
MSETIRDQWAQWLLHRRHGGDAKQQEAVLDFLYPVRDQVLRNSKAVEGDVLLDVGTGDGLIAFSALELVGEHGTIIFSDISQDLLDHCRSLGTQMGILDQCQFIQASADDLSVLGNASVDVITVRSVLIYVEAKQRSFQEFYRVLKTGGRLSIFEPINKFGYPEPEHMLWGYDVTPILDTAQKVRAVYHQLQPPGADPMLDFDEYDLLSLAEKSGFDEVHLELQIDITPVPTSRNWEALLRTAPNPRIPTLEEAVNQALTKDEAERFTSYLCPLVEAGQGTRRSAAVYLWAVKH